MFFPIEFERFTDMLTVRVVLGYVLIAALNSALMYLIAVRFFQVMQQCGYRGKEYIKWTFRRDNPYVTRLLMLSMLSLLGFLLFVAGFSFVGENWVIYIGFIPYITFLIFYARGEIKRKSKVPLVLTKRMIRLSFTFSLLIVLINLLLIFLVNIFSFFYTGNMLTKFRYGIICIAPITVPVLLLFAYYINEPLESLISSKYIRQTTEKLDGMTGLIKIGITGSFGKTSTKEILRVMLSEKYKVLATPSSFNTPMGISKTVKRLDETYDVFIAEMGARHVGDIKELAKMVKPTYAVITGVTNQHLETFGSLSNILNTKFELVENMDSGEAVFSVDNKGSLELYKKCKIDKKLAGLNVAENPFVYADEISFGASGTDFTLHIGDKSVKCRTKLLGRHNLTNLCLSATVAISLGVDINSICASISRIEPVKHRLEISTSQSGITIIDDSYNANTEGVTGALEVLKDMKGKRIIVTPGLVELGAAEHNANYRFGEEIAKNCDYVILVGRTGALSIREGLLYSEFPMENVKMVKDLQSAKEEISAVAKEGDTVLFENDLPDKYF